VVTLLSQVLFLKGNQTAITLVRKKEDPDEGYITLVFDNNPIALSEWSVVAGQGVETRVILSNMKSNVSLPAGLFNIYKKSKFDSADILGVFCEGL